MKGEIGSDFLTVAGVARELNIHVNTVRSWTTQGILPLGFTTKGGYRRYRKEDIESFKAPKNRQ